MALSIGESTTLRSLILKLKAWVAALSTSDVSGLGTAAVKNTGTSGNTVPLLDGANTWSALQTLQTSGSFGVPLRIEGTNAGAGGAYVPLAHNSASPANFDTVGTIAFLGKDSGGTETSWSEIFVQPTIVTDGGTEAGRIGFQTRSANANAVRFYLGPLGIYGNNATGGDKGADTVNAVAYYRNGVATGWKLLTSVGTTSGTSQSATSLTASDCMMLVFSGVSHNDGGSQSIRVEISDDGSNFGTPIALTAAVAAAVAQHGTAMIMGTGLAATTKVVSPNIGASGAASTFRDTGTEATENGITTTLRFSPSAGSFDAGTIYVYGAS